MTYSYDTDNRLKTAVKTGTGALSATLSYDAIGRLNQTAIAGVTTNLVYDGTDLITEYDAANTLLRRYVHGPGEDEPLVWYEGTGTTAKNWLYANQQGSIISTANNAGANTGVYTYGPSGEPSTLTGNMRFRYTGQTLIKELGLYYYKARFYSPTLGRFLQTDPIGNADDLNLYAYVGNNSINRVDPTGLYWFRQPWQTDYLVGREKSPVPLGGKISSFIENHIPAGRTLGEVHDAFVDTAVNKYGLPDLLVNVPSMIPMYVVGVGKEVLRTVGILDQPAKPEFNLAPVTKPGLFK